MLSTADNPMIETTISKGNTINDFNFIVNAFDWIIRI